MKVDKDAFEYAVAKIDDGDIFERFGTEFLAASLGYEFIPVGGSKDKGVDAFKHIVCRKHHEKIIFQLSTELDHEGKIFDTIKKLEGNKISYSKLFYVTNRKINNSEAFVDRVHEETGTHLTIFDIRWFSANCNQSERIIRVYQIFVDTYLHEYSKPGKFVTISNLLKTQDYLYFLDNNLKRIERI